MNKKGIELSINFVVILIFSTVVFSLSLVLLAKFFAFAEAEQHKIDEQTKLAIQRRLIQANDQVAIPQNKLKLKLSQDGSFGLGIRNTFSTEREFGVKMQFSRDLELPDESEVEDLKADGTWINENWFFTSIPPRKLKATETLIVPLSIKVDSNIAEDIPTQKDRLYVFNVCVFKMNSGVRIEEDEFGVDRISTPCNSETPKDFLYSKRLYKAYVEVS